METLFENRFVQNEAQVREIYAFITFHPAHRWFNYLAVSVGFFVWACFALYSPWFWAAVIGYAALFVITSLITFRRSVKWHFSQLRERGGGQIPPAVRTVSETAIVWMLEVTEKDLRMEIPIDRFRYAAVLRNSVLLVTKGNVWVEFAKDGFTKGTAEEFIAFLKEKGVKII